MISKKRPSAEEYAYAIAAKLYGVKVANLYTWSIQAGWLTGKDKEGRTKFSKKI